LFRRCEVSQEDGWRTEILAEPWFGGCRSLRGQAHVAQITADNVTLCGEQPVTVYIEKIFSHCSRSSKYLPFITAQLKDIHF
jgi:hypothetical protein